MSWIKSSLIILITTVLLFMFVDYGLTIFKMYPTNEKLSEVIIKGKKLRIQDKIFHHGFSPSHRGMQKWSNYLYEVCTDQHSFKISCSDFSSKTEKYFDIAFIGDSFTEAIGMEYEDSFVGLFAADNPELRVANLGVSSYSPSTYYAKLKYLLAEGYMFDHIFIFIDISDIQDEAKYLLESERVVEYKENNWESKKNKASYDWVPNKFYYDLKKNLKLSSIVYSLILYGEVNPTSYRIPARITRGEWTYNTKSLAYGLIGVSGAKEKSLNVMEKIYELLKGHDIKMSVGVYPWPNQIFSDKLIGNQQSIMWETFCIDKCEYFFDVFKDFSGLVNSSSSLHVYNKYFILGDVHFSKAGNRLVYERINQTLGEEFDDTK